MYEISLKYLLQFSSNGVDAKFNLKVSKGNNSEQVTVLNLKNQALFSLMLSTKTGLALPLTLSLLETTFVVC